MNRAPVTPICLTGDIDDGHEDLETCLRPLVEMLESCDVRYTVPVTSVAVSRNPQGIGFLADHGVELAGHGDLHTGFVGPAREQVQRLREMKRTFKLVLGVEPLGFRAPYLRHDASLYPALSQEGFRYDSSRVSQDPLLCFRHLLSSRPVVRDTSLRSIPGVLRRYASGASRPRRYPVAPGVTELPVFELDDWFFFEDRQGPLLGAGEEEMVATIWYTAWRHFRRGGNILVIQAHPNRMSPRRLGIIQKFIDLARAAGAPFLTLGQAANWETRIDARI